MKTRGVKKHKFLWIELSAYQLCLLLRPENPFQTEKINASYQKN